MKTVAVIEGWAGGPILSRQFRRELESAGFTVTNHKLTAEILVAHSAGCYDIPPHSQANLVMLIDPPYWPGKSVLGRMFKKENSDTRRIIRSFGYKYLAKLKLWEAIYIFLKPSYTILGLRGMEITDLLAQMRQKRVVVVRNQHDYFCTPDIGKHLRGYENVSYSDLPGEHDDYYTNPGPYIDLLLKEI